MVFAGGGIEENIPIRFFSGVMHLQYVLGKVTYLLHKCFKGHLKLVFATLGSQKLQNMINILNFSQAKCLYTENFNDFLESLGITFTEFLLWSDASVKKRKEKKSITK